MQKALSLLFVAACSSSSSGGGVGGGGGLATESHTFCVTPSAAAQDVDIPVTGGISGTLSFAAFPEGQTGCDGVKVSTGSDVRTVAPRSLQILAMTAPARPIFTMTIGDAFDVNPIFGVAQVVTNVKLKTSPDLNFPDGVYYMTITRGGRVDLVQLVASGGELTVAPVKTPNGNPPLPVLILANATAVLRVYPKDVLPTPVDLDSPVQNVDLPPGALPPLPAEPPPHPDAEPMFSGSPPPSPGEIGTALAVWKQPCINVCETKRPIQTTGADAQVDGIAGMNGTISFQANIGYMGVQSVAIDCPPDWSVEAGVTGSGVVTIPVAPGRDTGACTLTYSTAPLAGGSGYGITLHIRMLDTGAH